MSELTEARLRWEAAKQQLFVAQVRELIRLVVGLSDEQMQEAMRLLAMWVLSE
jgi:hypothetical protein